MQQHKTLKFKMLITDEELEKLKALSVGFNFKSIGDWCIYCISQYSQYAARSIQETLEQGAPNGKEESTTENPQATDTSANGPTAT